MPGRAHALRPLRARELRVRCGEEPVPIAERRSDLPAPLVDLVGAMLAKDPGARPTAAEARERLAAVRS